MHKLMALIFAGSAMAASAQVAVPGVATPVPAEEIPAKRVAVFVQNRTRVKAIDDEIDGIRDRLTSSLAAVDGLQLVDSSQVADSFRRYKVNTDEEKKELVSGIFTGGSIPNIARMLNCDYIIAASVVGASSLRRKQGDQPSTVFTLRMTTKIMDASGANVSSVPPWTGSFPVLNESGDDPMNYYNILFDRWVGDCRSDRVRRLQLAQTDGVGFSDGRVQGDDLHRQGGDGARIADEGDEGRASRGAPQGRRRCDG